MYSTQKSIKLFNNKIIYLNIISQFKYAKDVRFGPQARHHILQGINILTDAVSVTIGPKGRNVIVEQVFGPPKITKDGVTVAKSIILSDKFKNIGAKLIQNVAVTTKEDVGDGTSTATILARAIAKEGVHSISRGVNPIKVRFGIMLAVNTAIDELRRMSKPIVTLDEIEHIAIVAANGDKIIGKLIANAMNKVGRNGIIIVKTGKILTDEMEVIEGIKLERGFISSTFINSQKDEKIEYNNALVLLSDKKIFYPSQILPAMEAANFLKQPLIIIAEDYEQDVVSLLALNKIKAGLPIAPIKAPGFGEYRRDTLIDLAILTGGIVFEDNANLIRLEDCQPQSFGKVGEVVITKNSTLLLRGEGDKNEIKQRIEELNLDFKKISTDYDKKKLLDRLARLKTEVVIIRVGGSSEVEINEKKDRVNDALNATYAGMEEGVVPGGGIALIRCIPALKKIKVTNNDEAIGIDIVKNALRAPCVAIINNAGLDGERIASNIEKTTVNYGYDIIKNEYINMFEKGIIDSTKVVIGALIKASSIASLLTTTEAVICNLNLKDNK